MGAPKIFVFRMRLLLIVGLAIAAIAAMLFFPPIPQDASYHNFADQRKIIGIPNALNVISNAFLAMAGLLGLLFILNKQAMKVGGPFMETWERLAFLVMFVGTELAALGSAYYHLAPDNSRLFWDRLPMTVVFMSLFSIVIAERISLPAGRHLFLPLMAMGIGSVVYWHLTEIRGVGDLRLYGLVQFFPMLAIPLMLFLFPARYTRTADFFGAVGWYALAKIFEVLDAQVFAMGNLLSGHSFKHLASGLAAYWILRMVKTRRPVNSLTGPKFLFPVHPNDRVTKEEGT